MDKNEKQAELRRLVDVITAERKPPQFSSSAEKEQFYSADSIWERWAEARARFDVHENRDIVYAARANYETRVEPPAEPARAVVYEPAPAPIILSTVTRRNGMGNPQNESPKQFDERTRAAWEADEGLRAEFADNFEIYQAYQRASAAGRIKVLGADTIRG